MVEWFLDGAGELSDRERLDFFVEGEDEFCDRTLEFLSSDLPVTELLDLLK